MNLNNTFLYFLLLNKYLLKQYNTKITTTHSVKRPQANPLFKEIDHIEILYITHPFID